MHPNWVAKSPGTFDHTRERWNLHQQPPSRMSRPRSQQAGWDASFTVAHGLDGTPVRNGVRVQNLARRRHNGGIGAEGLL